MAKVPFKTAYGPRHRAPIILAGASLARQEFREECDINNIMKRFERTGLLEHVREHGGRYGDFTGVQSFQECLDQVIAARDMFMTLPAKVRADFDNDPGRFLEHVLDPANEEDLRERGLMPPIPAEKLTSPPDGAETPVEGDPTEPVSE